MFCSGYLKMASGIWFRSFWAKRRCQTIQIQHHAGFVSSFLLFFSHLCRQVLGVARQRMVSHSWDEKKKADSLKWQLLSLSRLGAILFASRKIAFLDKKDPTIQFQTIFPSFAGVQQRYFHSANLLLFPPNFQVMPAIAPGGDFSTRGIFRFASSLAPYVGIQRLLFCIIRSKFRETR